MTTPTLTLFYDGQCPLCVREMSQLKKLDKHGRLCFEDILAPDFNERFPQLSIQRANRIMHAQRSDGVMLEALDAVHAAWSLPDVCQGTDSGLRLSFAAQQLAKGLPDLPRHGHEYAGGC